MGLIHQWLTFSEKEDGLELKTTRKQESFKNPWLRAGIVIQNPNLIAN
jgi:hypothetical protein